MRRRLAAQCVHYRRFVVTYGFSAAAAVDGRVLGVGRLNALLGSRNGREETVFEYLLFELLGQIFSRR